MTDNKKLISNIGWLLFDKFFLLAFNLIIIFVVANHYGATTYGIFQYATNIVLIIEVIVQLMDGRVIKKLYKYGDDDKIIFNVVIGKIFLSTVALLIGVMVSCCSTQVAEFRTILYILLFDSIIKNLRFGMENRFEYDLQSKRVVIASNIGLSIGLICQIIVVLLNWSIITIAIIQMIATSISLIVLKIQYNKLYFTSKKKKKIDYSLIKNIVKESLPLAIAAAAAIIYMKCDSVMLGAMLSTKEVGIYSISVRLISALQMLIFPIQSSIFTEMIDWYGKKEYEDKYVAVTALCTWISIIFILFSLSVLSIVFKFLKPEYLPAMESYKILTIGSIFAYNAILRSSHFTLSHDGNILMITQIVTVILNIILNYAFIRIWGMNGVAFATVVSQFFSLFLSNLFYKNAKFVFKAQIKGFNPIYVMKAIAGVVKYKK